MPPITGFSGWETNKQWVAPEYPQVHEPKMNVTASIVDVGLRNTEPQNYYSFITEAFCRWIEHTTQYQESNEEVQTKKGKNTLIKLIVQFIQI